MGATLESGSESASSMQSSAPNIQSGVVPAVSQVPAVSGVQVPAVSGVQVPVVSGVQVPAVSGVQVPAVSGVQVPAVSGVQVPAVSGVQVPAVSGVQVPAVSGVQVPAVSGVQVPAVSGVQVPAVSGAQVPAVSGVQVPAVSGAQVPTNPLKTFSENVKATYTNPNFFLRASGPHFGKLEFINLALIKKQNINDVDKMKDKFLRDSLHGLVDDIFKKKKKIKNHTDIFNYSTDGRKLILVEGSPGVGKTMLAMKICQDWAKNSILAEYEIVLLVHLRRFQREGKLGLGDLVDIYCGDAGIIAQQISQILVQRGGEGVLLILEGWDELHPVFRREGSLFFDLITADKLPKASVLVTSRPTVTDTVAVYMEDRHIEVLGFRPDQIRQYVEHNFSHSADLILAHLEKFPNLHALAHIPLTLSIICRVVKDEHTLPSTLTELYDRYICQLLFKAANRKITTLVGLNSLDELPDIMQGDVHELSKIALNGLKEKRYVFTSQELSQVTSRDGHGLLTLFTVSAKAGQEHLYQFMHLSIQEFLAALHISTLPSQAHIELLDECRGDKQFRNVWKFLAGVTKLQDPEFQNHVIRSTGRGNESQLFLVHCLYEAHDEEICRIAANKIDWKLNLSNMSLNTTDCLCAAYAVTSSHGQWTLDLRNCNIGAGGLEIFKQHMIDQHKMHPGESTEFCIKELK